MYWDDWIKAGAFVLLVSMGFGLHYLSSLDSAGVSARGTTVVASRSEEPPGPAGAESSKPAPASPASTEAAPTAPSSEASPAIEAPPPSAIAQAQSAQAGSEPRAVAMPGAENTNAAAPAPEAPGNVAPSADVQMSPPAAWPALGMPAATKQQTADDAAPEPAAPEPQPDAQTPQQATPTPPAEIETPATATSSDAMGALRAAARTDDARAQYALALAYKMGHGVPADPAQSLLWLRRSAQNGLAVAARALGIAYEEGIGVEKDAAEAAKWYTRAALAGDLQAMHNLAFFFTQGLGGLPRDGRQAAHWFRKAAERGLTASQVNLAILTSQGEQWGIEKKLSDAYFWSAIAADHGDPQATKMRDLLGKLFAPKEKDDLDKKIAVFRPLPIDIVANGGFEVAPDAFLPKSLRPPLSSSELTTIRHLLKSLGYSGNPTRDPVGAASEGLSPTDTTSGAIDEKTELAIRAFQNDYGLPVTGDPDRNLLAALKAVPR